MNGSMRRCPVSLDVDGRIRNKTVAAINFPSPSIKFKPDESFGRFEAGGGRREAEIWSLEFSSSLKSQASRVWSDTMQRQSPCVLCVSLCALCVKIFQHKVHKDFSQKAQGKISADWPIQRFQ